jgi:AcrR family transcriptional regulator
MQDLANRPYHHGDLRRVIVETAASMLSEENGWQFTLREVARRAGVSHGAPYKHFPDKDALLAELALRGFDQLGEQMRAAVKSTPRSVRKAILAVAHAYIEFGLSNRSLYRLMFTASGAATQGIQLSERALATMGVLLELLQRGQQSGVFKRKPVQGQAAACWAQVHGLTMLSIDRMLVPEKVGDAPVEAALGTLLEGLVT